ncbi:hypothetical protein HAX54_008082, partial [Datura stramonium]|nr:hypothetical protein [Datura stramonium]
FKSLQCTKSPDASRIPDERTNHGDDGSNLVRFRGWGPVPEPGEKCDAPLGETPPISNFPYMDLSNLLIVASNSPAPCEGLQPQTPGRGSLDSSNIAGNEGSDE